MPFSRGPGPFPFSSRLQCEALRSLKGKGPDFSAEYFGLTGMVISLLPLLAYFKSKDEKSGGVPARKIEWENICCSLKITAHTAWQNMNPGAGGF